MRLPRTVVEIMKHFNNGQRTSHNILILPKECTKFTIHAIEIKEQDCAFKSLECFDGTLHASYDFVINMESLEENNLGTGI